MQMHQLVQPYARSDAVPRSSTELALVVLSCSGATQGCAVLPSAGECGTSSIRLAQAVHNNGPVLDDEILADKGIQEAIRTQVRGCISAHGVAMAAHTLIYHVHLLPAFPKE